VSALGVQTIEAKADSHVADVLEVIADLRVSGAVSLWEVAASLNDWESRQPVVADRELLRGRGLCSG
jgi:hypothetical protein